SMSPAISRWIGTAVGIAGAAILLLALGLSWPRPLPLVLIGCLNAAMFLSLGLALRVPQLHVPAAACFTIGFVTLFHWLRGDLVDAESGLVLIKSVTSPLGAIGLTC